MSYWSLNKTAFVRIGYGVDSQCTDCTTNAKRLAIACIGNNINSPIRCITSGQTNEYIAVASGTQHPIYSFTNNIWDAKDWQSTSLQKFNGQNKVVGAYNCYQESDCSGGLTTSLYYSWAVPQLFSFTDNGSTATLVLRAINQSKYLCTSVIKLFEEINGVWVESSASNIVPINTQSNTNGYYASSSIVFNGSDSGVAKRFKASSIPLDSVQFTTITYPITITTYTINGIAYTPTTTITAASASALATALNADLLTQGTLPVGVAGAKYFSSSTNIILSLPSFSGDLADYVISKSGTSYESTSNLKTTEEESWTDIWIETVYTNTEEKYTPEQNADLVQIGQQYCKIKDYQCIGRFSDVPYLQDKLNSQLVKILATNDTFFNTLL